MESRTTYTVMISLVVALGGFLLGFDSAVISGAVPFIETFFGRVVMISCIFQQAEL